jgi:hypothetical protein
MAKKAFLSGLENYGTPSSGDIKPLPGVMNDLNEMEQLLTSQGFIVVNKLVDDGATRDGLLVALSGFISSGEEDDYLVWFHSGHGSHKYNPAEKDQFSEILVTFSIDWLNPLWDSDLEPVLNAIHPRAKLLAVIDACHSEGIGSTKKLSAPWSPIEKFVSPPEDVLRADELIQAAVTAKSGRAATGPINDEKYFDDADFSPAYVSHAPEKKYSVLTSARFNQTAKIDFFERPGIAGKQRMSVFTYALVTEVSKSPGIGLGALAWAISRFSKERWSHVATLQTQLENVEASFGEFLMPEKGNPIPNTIFLSVAADVRTEPAVLDYLVQLQALGITLIDVDAHAVPDLKDFTDVATGLDIRRQDGTIVARIATRSGVVLQVNRL